MLTKKIFILFLLICYTGLGFSQNIEKQLLKDVCETIIKQNDYSILKQHLNGYSVIEDPVSGNISIKSSNKVAIDKVQEFNQYNKKEQIELLTGDFLPISPLSDTIIILDTLNFFSEGCTYFSKHYYFEVRRKLIKKVANRVISIFTK